MSDAGGRIGAGTKRPRKPELNRESIEAARKALDAMAKKAKTITLQDVAMELDEEISVLSKAGYSYKQIAETFKSVGIPMSTTTLSHRRAYRKARWGSNGVVAAQGVRE